MDEKERASVEELADRIDNESFVFDGWSKRDLLAPQWYKGEQTQAGLRQRQRPEFFTEIGRWKSFRECLRNHHPFLTMPPNNERALESDSGLGKAIHNLESSRGFEVWTTIARRNFFDFESHRRSSEDLLITVLAKDGCWVQLLQEGERYCKILGIVNTGRPKSLRLWISGLKQLLIDDCGFGFVWGHAMQVKSNRNYPHNSKIDRRFESWKTVKFKTDEGPLVYKLNRLTKLWLRMGFSLAPSPDRDGSPALALYCGSFFQELLELEPTFWKQFEEFNSSF